MAEHGESLSERETEILEMVATGITNREVAQALFISVNTVKVHLRNIYTKLGAESRTEATMMAVRDGLIVVEGITDEMQGADEAESPETVETIPEPRPPLPLFKRIALVGALFLVIASVALTWPRAAPGAADENPGDGPHLPLDRPPEQETLVSAATNESKWEEQAQMPTRRAYLATVAGDGRLFAIAGQNAEGTSGALEIYNPEENIWTRGRDKPTPVTYVSAAAVDGQVYAPGGCDAAGRPTDQVEVYDIESDSWRAVQPLPEPRCAYALTALEETLYLFGGWQGEQYVDSTYIYDVKADTWREAPPMNVKRGFAGAVSLGNAIYVVGGYEGEQELRTCAVYIPETEQWDTCPPLSIGRGGLGLANLGGQLYAIGGGGWTSYLGFNERYTPNQRRWTPIETPLVGEWRSPGVVELDTTLYAVGGWSGNYLSVNQMYTGLPYRIFIPVSNN